jgi:hypothetical protein
VHREEGLDALNDDIHEPPAATALEQFQPRVAAKTGACVSRATPRCRKGTYTRACRAPIRGHADALRCAAICFHRKCFFILSAYGTAAHRACFHLIHARACFYPMHLSSCICIFHPMRLSSYLPTGPRHMCTSCCKVAGGSSRLSSLDPGMTW